MISEPTTPAPKPVGFASGLALILFTLFSWASVPLFLRFFKDCHLDPFTQNGWRYGISAAFWLPLLVWVWSRGKLPKALFKAALVPAAFNIAGQECFAWGPTLLDPGFFSFVFRVQIVFVMLGAYMLFPSERATLRSPRFWVGLALVAAGSAGLILFKADAPHGATGLGIVVSLVAGFLFAGYALSVRYYVGQYAPVIAFGVICNYTAVLAVGVMLIMGERSGGTIAMLTLFQLGMLVLSAFIGIAISHVAYYAALKRMGVSVSIGIIQLQPIFTAVGSMLLFDERLAPMQWACGVVGLLGAVLMIAASGRKAAKAVSEDTP